MLPFFEALEKTRVATAIQGTTWFMPLANTIHALGMTLLLGSITLFRKVTQGDETSSSLRKGTGVLALFLGFAVGWGGRAKHFFGIAVLGSGESDAAQFQTSVNHAGCHPIGAAPAH